MRSKGWSDLPPVLLRQIAGCLHVAADFVSFHAVCSPWRSSCDLSPAPGTTSTQLLPWFLAPRKKQRPSSLLKLRCIFSKSSYRIIPPPYARRMNWVYSADGATVRYLTFKQLRPTMHDPNTGAVTDFPRFPCYFHHPWEENPYGIVYSDGTIFLYGIYTVDDGHTARFQGAVLRPDDADWTLVDRTFETNGTRTEFCAAYHSGRFLVSTESALWRVVTPDDIADVLVPMPCMAPDEPGSRWERSSYIVEYHGELMWVSVLVMFSYSYRFAPNNNTFLVSVHVLEEATMPEKVRWVRIEEHSLADRVLFLGSPNSVIVEASALGGQGGCAYFVYHNSDIGTSEEFGVFRYNFVDSKTERIERLPGEWDADECTWLVPQPTISSIQRIIRRKLQALKLKKQQKTLPVTSPSSIFHIERHYEHHFVVFVHNVPLNMKKSQLKHFFNKHGKVFSTEIKYHKNTKTSEGIVKMATMHAHEEDALAALNGLVFDRCRLEVFTRRQGKAYI
ncbi:unnamed protein product [Alopecurus aequalis]